MHEPKHDLESIIYVLIWICVLYQHPASLQGTPRSTQSTCLSARTKCNSLQEVQSLASLKAGELLTQVPVKQFTGYFEGLKDPVHQLYEAIARCYKLENPLTHDTVRLILLDAFFTVQEPQPTMDCV